MGELSWDDLSPLEREIFYFIFEMKTVSFINLQQRFPKRFPGKGKMIGRDVKGNRSIFWTGISREFTAVLTRLRQEGLIRITQCHKKVYLHDLSLFSDNTPSIMENPVWFPIVYDATEKGMDLIQSLDLSLLKQLMAQEIDYQLKLHTQGLDEN
ncbi:MAG: hypothetical protein ACFFGZ_14895 [Candidatus Thorarchaeota archaeon]